MSKELGACTADSNRRTKTLPGFYLSLLLPKTFCAIRSQWQRWWFNPRPTFCCPSSFVKAGFLCFWILTEPLTNAFFTLLANILDNWFLTSGIINFFAALGGWRVFRSDFWRNLFTCRHFVLIAFCDSLWDGNGASTMNVLGKWLQVC